MLLVLVLLPTLANAALFKCKGSDGRFTYSDRPCVGVEVPMQKQGSFSSVNVPSRQFVPAYQESHSAGNVSSAGSGTKSSTSSGSSSSGGGSSSKNLGY
jgi:uncharacterized membrane protein YgcG